MNLFHDLTSLTSFEGMDTKKGILFYMTYLGSGRGAMGRAWVSQLKGPVFNSQWIMVVSGRASNIICSCATLGYSP